MVVVDLALSRNPKPSSNALFDAAQNVSIGNPAPERNRGALKAGVGVLYAHPITITSSSA